MRVVLLAAAFLACSSSETPPPNVCARSTIWVAGDRLGSSDRMLLRFDGNNWSDVTPAFIQSGACIPSVNVKNDCDVWVGVNEQCTHPAAQGVFGHWDGNSWTVTTLPQNSPLGGIWPSDPTTIWVVAGSDILRIPTMDSFSVLNAPANFQPEGFWGVRPDAIWLLGTIGPSGDGTSDVVKWDGSTWSLETTVAGSTEASNPGLMNLTGNSADDLWAVGGATNANGFVGAVAHRTASGWSAAQAVAGSNVLFSACSTSTNDVWAVGLGPENSILHGVVAHYDGATWSPAQTLPQLPGINGLTSIWCGAPNDIWAVGGMASQNDPNTAQGIALHWTGGWGSAPDVFEVPGAGDLFGVSAAR